MSVSPARPIRGCVLLLQDGGLPLLSAYLVERQGLDMYPGVNHLVRSQFPVDH